MKHAADPARVSPGLHFLSGNRALAEGAIAAGCTFFAAYPITPSTDIAERVAERLPPLGGTFIEMEDELGALAAVLGAAWAGAKAMTSTSGPGFSLMMENYGLGQITETPCVIVNVQRGGPSTGLPTLVAQSEVLQTRWGSHGDYEAVALSPSSPQECYEMAIRAFNISERYRMPVVILSDEVVGHMTERVEVPPADRIELWERLRPGDTGEPSTPAYSDGTHVRPMPRAGDGTRVHVTGLTHDDRGYPQINAATQQVLVERILSKVRDNIDDLAEFEEVRLEDADVAVVTFGCTARSAQAAVNAARRSDIRAGMLRLKTIHPFPAERLRKLANAVDRVVVAELNAGQLSLLVEHAVRAPVTRVTSTGGRMLLPAEILKAIRGKR